jgi:hypothetical protein
MSSEFFYAFLYPRIQWPKNSSRFYYMESPAMCQNKTTNLPNPPLKFCLSRFYFFFNSADTYHKKVLNAQSVALITNVLTFLTFRADLSYRMA